MLSGRVRSKPCPPHQRQPKGVQVHFNMGALAVPRRQPKSVPESMLSSCEDASQEQNLLNRKKPGVYLEVWQGGFVGRFCGGILGLAGGFRRGRAPADFCFWLADFPAPFFSGLFSFAFCDQKSTAKIHRKIYHFHGGLLEDFPQ